MPPLLGKRANWLNQLNDEKIQDIPLTKYKIFYNKMDQVLKKNNAFKVFQNIPKVQAGKTVDVCQGGVLTTSANSSTAQLHRFGVKRSFCFHKHL